MINDPTEDSSWEQCNPGRNPGCYQRLSSLTTSGEVSTARGCSRILKS